MLEGRSNSGGWLVVGVAVVALVAFTGLLYVRGGSGPPIALSGSAATARPSTQPAASQKSGPPGSAPVAGGSGKPTASRPASSGTTSSAGPTAAVAGATSAQTTAPSRTPRPTRSPTSAATDSPSPKVLPGYQLPSSPQAATIALENGQGDCPNFPDGGVLAETSFTKSGVSGLSAKSPSGQKLSGRVKSDGSFTLSGTNPVERWVGTLSDTGGTGSYFIVSNDCTEGYETTIAFH